MNENITVDSLYKSIEEIILNQCDLEDLNISEIKASDSLMGDLGIDSIDFLEIVFEIEDKFGIKIPMEEWMQQVSTGDNPSSKENFKMQTFVENVHGLLTA